MTTEDQIIAEKDGSLTVNVNAGKVTLVNKDLTDEEIINTLCENYDGDSGLVNRDLPKYHQSIVAFARAILKKASEK